MEVLYFTTPPIDRAYLIGPKGRMTMRLNRTRRWRTPHTMAVFGAFLLAASLLAGGQPGASTTTPAVMAATAEAPVQPTSAADDSAASQAMKSNRKKFRVKLFLFRR